MEREPQPGRGVAQELPVILVHGLGRTPLSMLLLGYRLRQAGLATHTFGYVAAWEGFEKCRARLGRSITERVGDGPWVGVGHSLGTVLLRSTVGTLAPLPRQLFFLTPPTQACWWSRRLRHNPIYRVITGEMGQLLADEQFMKQLPIPEVPTTIYAGVGGPRNSWYPLGHEPNDGILTLSEMALPGAATVELPAWHTYIMNWREVAQGIAAKANELKAMRPD